MQQLERCECFLQGVYRIDGNFRGIQFSRKGHLQRFRDLIFSDGCSCIKNVRFANLIFVVCRSTAKTTKLGLSNISSHAVYSFLTSDFSEMLSFKSHSSLRSFLRGAWCTKRWLHHTGCIAHWEAKICCYCCLWNPISLYDGPAKQHPLAILYDKEHEESGHTYVFNEFQQESVSQDR